MQVPTSLVGVSTGTRLAPIAAPHARTLVVLPTYEEVDNIEPVLVGIRNAAPWADVMVVDDSSADGTAWVAQQVGEQYGHIRVLSRPVKTGLGAAYRAGIAHALERGYEVVAEMDADLSHNPATLPLLLEAVEHGADLAIGSRYAPGGATPDWPARRRMLSHFGNVYARFMLSACVSDLTSGFRAFRADALRATAAATTRASGYAFQIEMADRVARIGGTIVEVPIVFFDRTRGASKLSARIVGEGLWFVTVRGLSDRAAWLLRRFRRRAARG